MTKSIFARFKGLFFKRNLPKSSMNKYCEKTAVVEVYQFTKENFRRDEEPMWLKQAMVDGEIILFSQYGGSVIGGEVKTLKDTIEIFENDYIVKGVNGEFCPYKEDVFLATYEKIE